MAGPRIPLLLLLLLVTLPAPGGDLNRFRGLRVAAIGFEGSGLDPNEALSYIDIRVSDRFSIQAVRRSAKFLYYLDLFGQVRVYAKRVGNDLELTFQLVPKRRVLSVEFLGNDVVATSDLRRLTRLERGDEFDRWRMEFAASEMLALYRRSGYRSTRIVPKAEGPPEGDVRVRYYIQESPPTRILRLWFKGNIGFNPKRLAQVMNLDRGDVLDEERLQEGLELLRAFYRKHDYLEVHITPPSLDSEAATLSEVVPIEIQAGSKVVFAFEGNAVLSKRELLATLKIDQEVEFTSYVLRDLADHLEDLYRRNGFARVQVTPRVSQQASTGVKTISFSIEEGPRVTVREVRFEGNQAFSDDKLRRYLDQVMLEAIPQALIGQPVDPGDVDPLGGGYPAGGKPRRVNRPQGFLFELVPETIYLRAPYEKALGQIVDLYRSQGYLEVQAETPLLSYDATGSNLYITIPIIEGQRTRVESISFQGNQAMPARRLLEVAEQRTGLVRPGGSLDLYGVEKLRRELVRAYAREGYVYCRVTHRVRFSPDKSLAEVQFMFNEGPQVRVRRVLVRGNVVTDSSVFENILAIRPGEIFSPDQVASSQEDLLALDIFSGVDIKMLDPDVSSAEKDVVVFVRERLPHMLTISPGISSAEGVRLELDYTHRNLFGYAMELVGRAKANYQAFYPLLPSDLRERYEEISFFEGVEGWVVAGLHWPRVWWLGKNVSARVDLIVLQDHASDHDLTKISLTPGVDLKLTEKLVLSMEYELEYDQLGCPPGLQCGGATGERGLRYDEGRLALGAFRPGVSWDRRDNLFRPRRGSLMSLQTELANRVLLGKEVFYLKLDGLVSGYLPLGREATLALSVRGGVILHLTDNSRTPSHKLFFLGGRNTVRGFAEEALIPADQRNPLDQSSPCVPRRGDETGERCVSLGGNASLNLKSELRFPLVPEVLEGALFLDLGNLWVDPAKMDLFDLRAAAGFGVRLVTPIGPVAFDLGFNLAPDRFRREESWNLHFNIGVF